MTASRMYAAHMERKLIEEFKQKFHDKLGYEPIVLTKVESNEFSIPLMTLDQLKEYFDPFLPVLYGRKLELFDKSRKRELVELRMMFCYIARTLKYTLNTVGEFTGGRDHTTVIHNVGAFRNLIETNESFREKFVSILNHIKENHESPALDQLDQIQFEPEPALLP